MNSKRVLRLIIQFWLISDECFSHIQIVFIQNKATIFLKENMNLYLIIYRFRVTSCSITSIKNNVRSVYDGMNECMY